MQKDLKKLEYDQILQIFAEYAVTDFGKKYFNTLLPSSDPDFVQKLFDEASQASFVLERLSTLPLNELDDLDFEIKALRNGQTLSISSLLHLNKILQTAADLKAYFFNDTIPMDEFNLLEPYFSILYTNPSIIEKVQKAIFDENTLNDQASNLLRKIRSQEKQIENAIKDKLNHFIHTSKFVMEPIVTVRNDRYVVPIKDTYRSEVKGFIHDISASGSTVFIEPLPIFEMNNELANLRSSEMLEIERILQELTALFIPYLKELENNIFAIGKIDFIFAKAKYALQNQYSFPTLSKEKEITLLKAVHPLLDPKLAVPVDISFGKEIKTFVITGPNTGGKTVLLKTLGLLSLMACSGLPIPADPRSKIFVFDHIFADIGDEQSIQESLSTFSSHMKNIITITKDSTCNSLVLLDELGAGTDPIEGSQLAISILEHFSLQGNLTAVTTHYPEIKNYALTHSGFQNASFEFDLENLQPTYKLLVGVPGKSNALAICKRLGLPDSIIERASSFSSSETIQMEDLLKKIYDDKLILEEEKEKAQYYTKELEILKKELTDEKNQKIKEQEEQIKNAKREAISIIQKAKEEANQIIAELEEKPSLTKANKLRLQLNQSLQELTSQEKMESSKLSEKDISIGSQVLVQTLGQTGTIQSLPNRSSEVTVQIGNAKMKVKLADLTLLQRVPQSKKNSGVHTNISVPHVASEINVIALNVEEATHLIDQYIDQCLLAKFSPIRIVHGKGTGKLRNGIHTYLKKHPSVEDFRLGTYGEGEMGVTVVNLKIK